MGEVFECVTSLFRSRRPENDAPPCGATYFKSKHPLLWIDYILLRDYAALFLYPTSSCPPSCWADDVGFLYTATIGRGYKIVSPPSFETIIPSLSVMLPVDWDCFRRDTTLWDSR
jgi:hypothetical protein